MENSSDPQTVAMIPDGPLKYFHEELQDMPLEGALYKLDRSGFY